MKRYSALIGVIGKLFLILLGAFVLKQIVGDLRPAFMPPRQNLGELLEKKPSATSLTVNSLPNPHISEPVNLPLKFPSGFQIGLFAKNLGTPRDLEFSPDGVLLASIPNQGKIVALPDKNQDGQVDDVKTLITNLNRPHGITFYNKNLYIAELTQVVRYQWDEMTLAAKKDRVLFSLPYNSGHNTRSLVFNKQGQMFIALGSSCNVCYEEHEWLAAVIVSDEDGTNPRLFANGLRNSVFLTVHPETDELWVADMGRDYLGDNLPPEEINIVRDSQNYGWPICYGNKIHDTYFDKNQYVLDPCLRTESPIYEFQAHTAPLGVAFINSPQFPPDWQGDLLVSYHGSWNRSIPIGYKVVRMNVEGNTITNEEDFLTGFLQGSDALGRPVDVIFDSQGSLYISDDKAGVIYKIVKT